MDVDAGGIPSGLSWTNAFTTFEMRSRQRMMASGQNIWIAEGTYQYGNAFVIQLDDLSIYGGFAGTETMLSQRNWTNNKVIFNGEDTRRVLDIQADDTLLDGLVITNGYIPSGINENGAGIRMHNSGTGLTILNCRILDNEVRDDIQRGGGVYLNTAGTVLISNSVVNANRGYRAYGNGLYSESTTLTILDGEVVGNEDTKSGQLRQGKGFYLSGGSLTMVGTTVADNYGQYSNNDTSQGGGGYITGSPTVSFTNCIFSGNLSRNSDGGGLYVNNGNITIENCTFANNGGNTNSSSLEGGAIYQNSGTITIKNSIFWDNQIGNAADDGDTIYQTSGDTMTISYTCMDGTNAPRIVANGTLNWGDGIITNDPLFAVEYTDLHLQSSGGRWDGSTFVKDSNDSPCIDAGDPASDFSLESNRNGGRINLGAYGNTVFASRTGGISEGTLYLFR